jgi:hypothetical protein
LRRRALLSGRPRKIRASPQFAIKFIQTNL